MEQKILSSMMHEERVFYPPEELSRKAYIKSLEEYKKIYRRSLDDPEGFWGEAAQQLDWYKKWDKELVEDFKEAKYEWIVGGKLIVAANCGACLCPHWGYPQRCFRWFQCRGIEKQNIRLRFEYARLCRWLLPQ